MIHKTSHIKEHTPDFMELIRGKIYTPVAPLFAECYTSAEPLPFARRTEGKHSRFAVGQAWGSLFDCGWFRITGIVPGQAKGKKTVLLLDFSGEGCIVDKNGCPVRGITNVTSQFDYSLGMPGKRVVPFTEASQGGEPVDFWMDAACNDLFGNFKGEGKIQQMDIAICNEHARTLYYDLVVLYDLMGCIDAESPRYHAILYAIQEAVAQLSDFTDSEFIAAHVALAAVLDKKGGTPSLTFSAVGHAHIDLAWLWPLRETRRKGGRTFSTVLELMERYPDYIFGASQPQLYQWVKEDYPQLYEKVKERIREGRWEVQGGMWVESDTNVPCGESLTRQFLYGKRFFQQEFGIDVKSLWLPDVFGYSAVLPQLLKKSGCDYFSTIKLSWSKVNKFPYHTFHWRGLDDSEVLVHMPPEGTYNSAALPHSVNSAAKNYQEKGLADTAMMLFGIGDGGGGPGPEHLERLKRLENLDGCYPVKQQPSYMFFEQLAKGAARYPHHRGELYVERHQGTLTTQANNKKYNRVLEHLLHNAELLCSQARLANGAAYPRERLTAIWKEVLLYQFHDILPGSSIKRVYDESVARYKLLAAEVQGIADAALASMTTGSGDALYNPLPWDRTVVAQQGGKAVELALPAFGFGEIKDGRTVATELNFTANSIENGLIKVTFNESGFISSVYDKVSKRECIQSGCAANELKLFTDLGGDAWDFMIDYRGKKADSFVMTATETEITPTAVVRTTGYEYGESRMVQQVSLTHNADFVNFKTRVNWQEKDKMLRAEFPMAVDTDRVTCDIQFGSIQRSTTTNNSWDYAQIEVAAHKWIDLSDRDYGVALLSESKYGFYAKDGLISMNLLRAQNYPGVSADIGEHQFSYALYPHKGDAHHCGIVHRGYEYNYPPMAAQGGGTAPAIATASAPNIILETVKLAEDNDDIVLRFYECNGIATECAIQLDERFTRCAVVNLLEQQGVPLAISGNAVTLRFKPFEIHTLILGK